jgi:hypothetical protein
VDEPSVDQLERRILHVPEAAMRRALALETLRALAPERAYRLISRALDRGPAEDGSEFDRLRDAVHAALAAGLAEGSLSYEFRREVYALAAAAGDEAVMRVLRTQPAADGAAAPFDRELAEIPLGRRRSLARGGRPELLEKLARDPDRVVVRHLLANPRTREVDVVRMAALRPVAAATLEEIARCERWWTSERVRAALARNPACPLDAALRAVETLSTAVLRELLRDPDLHPELLRHAAAEMERRTRR